MSGSFRGIVSSFINLWNNLQASALHILLDCMKPILNNCIPTGILGQDPENRVISVVYFAIIPADAIINNEIQPLIKWFPVKELPDTGRKPFRYSRLCVKAAQV